MHNLASANTEITQAYEINTLLIQKIPVSCFAMFSFPSIQGWSIHHESVCCGSGM